MSEVGREPAKGRAAELAVAGLRRRQVSHVRTADAVFPTRNGTWHQVTYVERRWRQIRKDTGPDWVTPQMFARRWPPLIADQVDSETASQQLGQSSSSISRGFYIVKPVIAADVANILRRGHDCHPLRGVATYEDADDPDPRRRLAQTRSPRTESR